VRHGGLPVSGAREATAFGLCPTFSRLRRGRLVAENESTSVTFKHVGFIKFTPIKTTRVTYEGGLKFFNWTLIEPIKKVRTVITGVKKEYLGTSINPLDYVPKK